MPFSDSRKGRTCAIIALAEADELFSVSWVTSVFDKPMHTCVVVRPVPESATGLLKTGILVGIT